MTEVFSYFNKEAQDQGKTKVALLSLISNGILMILKLGVGFLTGSISVLSEAVHSAMDLVASGIALFAVKKSAKPADSSHLFGHGKFENLSGAVEAILVGCAALYIIWEALEKLKHGGELQHLEAAIAVMALSAILNTIVSRKLYVTAFKTDSLALEADALHLKGEVWTSLGVMGSMAVIYASDLLIQDPQAKARFHALDPLVALLVAAMILKASWGIFKRSIDGLLDKGLPEGEEKLIREILSNYDTSFLEFHELRHRKSGPERHIDLHLVVAPDATVKDVHDLCDEIEKEMREKLPRTNVLIHVEPCNRTDCPKCKAVKRCETLKLFSDKEEAFGEASSPGPERGSEGGRAGSN